jgi:hypothetical protein
MHDELRDSVSSARRHAHALSGGDASDLGRFIDYIIDEFERHEDAERELLRDFFSRGHEIDSELP